MLWNGTGSGSASSALLAGCSSVSAINGSTPSSTEERTLPAHAIVQGKKAQLSWLNTPAQSIACNSQLLGVCI